MTRGNVLAVLAALILVAAGCARPSTLELEGRAMGSTYHVRLAGAGLSGAERDRLHAEIEDRLRGLEGLLSLYDPASELSRFNASRSLEPFPVSVDTLALARAALRLSRDSGGAFDPTVAPLVDLWGFGPSGRKGPPAPGRLAAALRLVGARHVRLREEPPALVKDSPGVRLDLNSIADGYAADAVARLLEARGLRDFMVEVCGEVVARGRNARGKPWRIAIDLPSETSAPGRAFSGVVALDAAALSTSGSYRRFFRKGGRRYSHIIDPRTGRPVSHALASVSVTAPACAEADGASTAAMVLGPEDGLRWLKEKGYPAMLITAREDGTFETVRTPGFPSGR